MKRKISLLILVILAVCLTLTACNQTVATTIRTRWDKEGETHVFKISLADFAENSNSFNAYTSDGVVDSKGNYHKDLALTGEFYNWDEIKPVAVSGSYTINIKPSDDGSAYCDVTTVQEMCVQYDLTDLGDYSKVKNAVATAEQLAKYKVDASLANTVVLWTSTETYVRFENNTSQKPLKSSTTVNGFYVGKKNQNLTQYTVSTEYNYEAKRPIAKITMDGNTTEHKFPKNSAGNFIDSNQILLYLRSLDKSSTSFQDSPSISVFNPYTDTLQTASFGLSYENNVFLTGETLLPTNLNVVSVTVGNNAFMMQENLPDKLADKNLDIYITSGSNASKFTTVRFRVGYFAYEIDYANEANTVNWSDIWTALSPSTEEE